MASTPLTLGVFLSAILATPSAATTAPPGLTPVTTCCPPGSFLAIEDWQGSKQQPDGIWKDLSDFEPEHSDSGSGSGSGDSGSGSGSGAGASNSGNSGNSGGSSSGALPQPTPRIAAIKKFRSGQRGWDRDDWFSTFKWQYGRHHFINRVYCLPDQNNLPNIHAMPGSSYPRPPYWADTLDREFERMTFENYTWPLAENQTLWSQGRISQDQYFPQPLDPGDQLPSCPGGPNELATIVLGDGLYRSTKGTFRSFIFIICISRIDKQFGLCLQQKCHKLSLLR